MGGTAALHPTDQTLQAYSLGTLDEGMSASVDSHLTDCSECRRRASEISGDSFLGRLREAHGATGTQGRPPSSAVAKGGGSSISQDDGPPRELVDHPDYEVIRELGRGGMGVVYLAENTLMGRMEVLKVVGSHLVRRQGVLDRFLREIRSAAKLQHPNIVGAYAAMRLGEGVVLSMEYVEGEDLAKLVKSRGPLPVTNACYFIYQVALGLQHAHERGMVHRDIKPANLILAREGKKAIVKVLDFGLAKATSEGQFDAGLTHEGQMLGTPDFIAPEQIVDAQKADIRADIYSLGCTLYYLLSGGPPFRGTSLYDLLQAHHSMDAPTLNLARPEVPAELAALVAKMMAKEPAKRFQTPGEVAQSLTRFFKPGAQPGSGSNAELPRAVPPATPPTPAVTRPATDLGALAPAPSKGKSKASPEGVAWASLIEFKETEPSLLAAKPKPIEPKPEPTETEAAGKPPRNWWPVIAGASAFGSIALGIIITITTNKGTTKVNVPDDQPSKVATEDGVVVEYTPNVDDPEMGEASSTFGAARAEFLRPGAGESEERAGWTSLFDGKGLIGWKSHPSQPGGWQVENGVLRGSGPQIGHLYSDRGDYKDFHLRAEARFDKGGSGGIFFRSGFGPERPADDPRWPAGYEALIDSTRGDRGKTGSLDVADPMPKEVWVCYPLTQVPPNQWFTLEVIAEDNVLSVMVNGRMSAFHVDGKRRFTAGHVALQQLSPGAAVEFRSIAIKELGRADEKDSREIRRFAGHGSRVSRVAFSPDERTVLTAGDSGEAVIHNDGKRFIPGGNDKTVRTWETDGGRSLRVMSGHGGGVRSLAYSPDGRRAASTSAWNSTRTGVVMVWDVETGRKLHEFSHDSEPGNQTILAVAFSPDGRRVLAAYSNGMVQAWELGTGKEPSTLRLKVGKIGNREITGAAFSPDGRRLVTGSRPGMVELWDLEGGAGVRTFVGHSGAVGDVAFSEDGRLVLSGGSDNTLRLWSVETGKEIRSMRGDDRLLRAIALSPDGRRALSAGNDAVIRLWDLDSGRELCRLRGHSMPVNSVAFSKDGRRALSGSHDRTVRLWQLPVDGPAQSLVPTTPVAGPAPEVQGGVWKIEGDDLVQSTLARGAVLLFGDPVWSSYDFKFRAMSTGGTHGFKAKFHAISRGNACEFALGNYFNKYHDVSFDTIGRWGRADGMLKPGHIDPLRWYDVRLEVRGAEYRAFLDNTLLFQNRFDPVTSGRVGFATWDNTARFREIEVTAPDGRVLWRGLPVPPAVRSSATAEPMGAVDHFRAGSVWMGERSYRRGTFAGTTVTYELHVTERDGSKFLGYVFDNGRGRNRAEVEGEVDGTTIAWRERSVLNRNGLMRITGTFAGNTIALKFDGHYGPGLTNGGDGALSWIGGGTGSASEATVESVTAPVGKEIGGEYAPLFNGKDLTGWKPADAPDDRRPDLRWEVVDGAILSSKPPTWTGLVTTRTDFANFHLRFETKLSEGTASSIQLRRHGGADGLRSYTVAIAGTATNQPLTGNLKHDGTGEIRGKASPVAIVPGEWFPMEIIADGDTIVSIVKGKEVSRGKAYNGSPSSGAIGLAVPAHATFSIRKIEIKELPPPPGLAAAAPSWRPVFNGKDIASWWAWGKQGPVSGPEMHRIWTVRDGDLIGSGGLSHLFSPRGDYANFRVRARVKINEGGNSGLYFRAAKGAGFPEGYEAQINTSHGDPNKTGSIYKRGEGAVRSVAPSPVPSNTWFTLEAEAVGNRIRVRVDGKLTAEWTDPKQSYTRGHFAIQVHDPQSLVQVRKLEVMELDGAGRPLEGPAPSVEALVKPAAVVAKKYDEIRTMRSRPGALKIASAPPDAFWPQLTPDDTAGWRVGDPASVAMKDKGLVLEAGVGGNFLITRNAGYKKGSISVDLSATEGTEAYLVLRAVEGPEGWSAVTSRIVDEGGKIRVGAQSIDFALPEGGEGTKDGEGRVEFAPRTNFRVKFSIDAKGKAEVVSRGKVVTSITHDGPRRIDGTAGAVGLFVRTGSLTIRSLRVEE